MSKRLPKKQLRRAEREQQERQAAVEKRNRRRLFAATVVAIATVGVGIVAFAGSNDEAGKTAESSESPFGQHYAGLEQRRLQAGVLTMSTANLAAPHIHMKLSLSVDGKRIGVPSDIGIDPQLPPGEMASLHTHTPDGIVHDEGQGNATLAMFFTIWGVPFSANNLGPYRASAGKSVQMWVDGKRTRAFGALKLKDAQQIVVSFGRPSKDPPSV